MNLENEFLKSESIIFIQTIKILPDSRHLNEEAFKY
jgi:hypothetical protein